MNINKLYWLAGAWDGEGSITVFKYREKNNSVKLCPTICFTNTDAKFVAEVVKILDENGIRLHLETINRKNAKECYQLITRRMETIRKFLDIIAPYLVSKKPQAQLLTRFLNSRLKHKEAGKKWGHNTPYSDEDYDIEKQMRILNGRGPRDYTSNSKEKI